MLVNLNSELNSTSPATLLWELGFCRTNLQSKRPGHQKNTTRSIHPLLSPSSQKTSQEIVKTIFIIGIPLIALMLIRQKIFGTWHIYRVENVPGLTAQKPSKWLNFRSERNKEHRHIYSAFTYRLDNSDSYNSLFSLFLYARVGTCSIVFPRNIITIRVEKPHEHKPCSAC
jgi:hypothetical protein